MDDIKSALELAMEKIEKLGEVTEEERLDGSMSQRGRSWLPDILRKILILQLSWASTRKVQEDIF